MFTISMLSSLVLAAAVVPNKPPADCRNLPDPKAQKALPNDNRRPAGTLKNGVLTLRLIARPAAWHPEGSSGCGIRVHAFAEEGKQAQIPGPLMRVRVGTEVRVTVRNELGQPLKIRGLFERRPDAQGLPLDRRLIDSTAVEIAAGASREIRFRATEPGNFYYWGITPIDTIAAFPRRVPGAPLPLFSPFEDGQLVGALIVDPEGGSPPDRIFVLTHWVLPGAQPDELVRRQINGINGLSWPHTEQLSAQVGDTLRWRVLNPGTAPHTMHLHGFYFRVLSAGSQSAFDSILALPQQPRVVSEFMPPNRTMTLEWSPERAGNWLFHCHWLAHMAGTQRIDRVFETKGMAAKAHTNHAGHDMAGLVMGIAVKAPGSALRPPPAAQRQLRLYASERARVFGQDPGFGFVLQEGPNAPAADSIRIPGAPLVLTRGEPTQITVFNRLRIPLAVHWHGIELESYYDGVPDFSGSQKRLAPAIAPGDSFVVHMTPPRAGTFFYHIHSEQDDELNSGLYGSLLVLDPTKKHDPSVDRTFVLSAGGRGPRPNEVIFVNGSTGPEAIEMTAGVTQRWRFISIPANGGYDVRITGGTTPLKWRQVARDGADLPAQQIVEGPAQARIIVGITMDFEVTPDAAGDFVLQVALPLGLDALSGFATKVPIRVRPADAELRFSENAAEQRRLLERALVVLDDADWSVSSNNRLELSDLLWLVFCAVEMERPGARNEACAAFETEPGGFADERTVGQARAFIRRAIERARP